MLCLVTEVPRHGFALRSLTARDGEVGRVWFVAAPLVYRASTRLSGRTEPGDRGPQRTAYALTRRGRAAARDWLARPVDHVRDLRSELLPKLTLLERAGVDPTALVAAQTRCARTGPPQSHRPRRRRRRSRPTARAVAP